MPTAVMPTAVMPTVGTPTVGTPTVGTLVGASLAWQGRSVLIRACAGPERIETGWWGGAAARRDYYRVETESGARYWIFRDLAASTWFLHGLFT